PGVLGRPKPRAPAPRAGNGPNAAKGRGMASTRSVDTDGLRRDLEATRISLSATAGELRQKVGKAVQWQTYVERHPAPILGTVALLGFTVGRRLALSLLGSPRAGSRQEYAGDPFRPSSAPLQKLDSRVEALVNRVIDEVADTAERALVPALALGLQALFEGRRAQDARRPPSSYNASVATAGEGRSS